MKLLAAEPSAELSRAPDVNINKNLGLDNARTPERYINDMQAF